jgi:thiol:disulfide interchange protein
MRPWIATAVLILILLPISACGAADAPVDHAALTPEPRAGTPNGEQLKASEVLAAALAEAGDADKLVFLHSGAQWCGWCRRLETWMTRPEIVEILAKDFVPVKIDMDRMLGAKAINDRYVDGYGGIPWIVILDPDGELVADSFNEEGRNIGSPYYDWEIEYFGVMMRQVARNISEADIETMLASFVEAREAGGD